MIDAAMDPTHRPSSGRASWTTGNVGEAIPGVQTPLSYTFWVDAFERTVRGSYSELGVLSRAEGRRVPQTIEETSLGIFYGRTALNVNLILEVGAGMPGVTARDVARNVLGAEDLAYIPPNRPRRYPVVAVKLPWLTLRLASRMTGLGDQVRQRWTAWAQNPPTSSEVLAQLPQIRELFTLSLLNHSHATFLSQACYEQLEKVATAAGHHDILSELLSGYGGMLEVRMLQHLWEVANDRREMASFLAEYGYQGPNAGNLKSRPWREDVHRLEQVCQTYRTVAEGDAPVNVEHRRREVRQDAERTVLRGLPPAQRPAARVLFRLARHFIPLREVGKSMYLQAGDTARIGIRAIGASMERHGFLDDAEDVYFLTYPELVTTQLPGELAVTIDARRSRWKQYHDTEIPTIFTGTPEPVALCAGGTGQVEFGGVGASGGIVEGTARVIADPSEDCEPLENGEILVAAATDPSWTTLFLGASAVVIDVGGNLSHGAIVARELGIPCVTNTHSTTAEIGTGDHIRVDGNAGTVTILKRHRD